jgi:hypothetical protein
MLLNTWKCGAVLACAAMVLAGLSVAADDKAEAAPSGVWVQTGGEHKIEFADKGVMKIHPHGDKVQLAIVCKCTAGKDGVVKAKVTEIEGKEDVKNKVKEVVPVGLEFSFKWQVKDDKAMLDDLKGDKTEVLKSHLEGKYDKK